jgi:hypothetical protein
MLKIGFATEFFTLWDVTTTMNYYTDMNGKHWPSYVSVQSSFIKNISFDWERVVELHPGVELDENLRGKTQSWVAHNKETDLSPEILKFGKYAGKLVLDVWADDQQYILWLLDNYNNATTDYLKTIPVIDSFLLARDAEIMLKINSHTAIAICGTHDVLFATNPNHSIYSWINPKTTPELANLGGGYAAEWKPTETTTVFIIFKEVNRVAGKYPYNMPYINGVPRRVKNKTFQLNLRVLFTDRYVDHITQYAIIE